MHSREGSSGIRGILTPSNYYYDYFRIKGKVGEGEGFYTNYFLRRADEGGSLKDWYKVDSG